MRRFKTLASAAMFPIHKPIPPVSDRLVAVVRTTHSHISFKHDENDTSDQFYVQQVVQDFLH